MAYHRSALSLFNPLSNWLPIDCPIALPINTALICLHLKLALDLECLEILKNGPTHRIVLSNFLQISSAVSNLIPFSLTLMISSMHFSKVAGYTSSGSQKCGNS